MVIPYSCSGVVFSMMLVAYHSPRSFFFMATPVLVLYMGALDDQKLLWDLGLTRFMVLARIRL